MFPLVSAAFILAVACGCSKNPGPGSAPTASFVRPAAGTLELCALANPDDDADAIEQATELFAAARSDPKLAARLRERAEANEPPPPPTTNDGPEFVVGNDVYTYRWAPVSDGQLRSYLLEPVPDAGLPGASLYNRLKAAREEGRLYVEERQWDGQRSAQLWWSRERLPRNGWPAGVEYFLLVREEPRDQAIQAEEVRHMYWDPSEAADGFRLLYGELDETGTEKFAALTTRNRPTKTRPEISTVRMLAILIRGKVVAAPTVSEPITTGRFVIRGRYTDQEAADLLGSLRGD